MLLPSIFGEDLFDDWLHLPMDRELENSFFRNRNSLFGRDGGSLMKTDVKETEENYEVTVELPGLSKEDLKLSLENGYLTIAASKRMDKDEKDEKGTYIRRERYAGTMSRSFYVGEGVTEEEIRAKFENGILSLSLPRKEQKTIAQKNYIAIEG